MSHRLVLAAAAATAPILLLCAASPALAQEAQSPWNGFYAGVNMGGAWGSFSSTTRVAPGTGPIVIPPANAAAINGIASGNSSPGGFTGGIEGGYNHITSGGVLFGLETDWGAMDMSQNIAKSLNATDSSGPVTYGLTGRASTSWVWTLRPRVGFVTGNWLLYGTIGMAVTDIRSELAYADTHGRAVAFTDNDTKTGWAGGLGAAYAFAPQWSVKGEWLYADFGKVAGNASSSDGFVAIGSEGLVKANLFRAGIDYRF